MQRRVWFGSYRGFQKEAKYLVYATLLPAIASGMLYTDLPYFLTRVQGLPSLTMGLVMTIMGVSAFGASIPLGMIADKYGRKRVLITGNVVASATIGIFALTADPVILALAAILTGISEGAATAATGALLAEKCEVTQRNSIFSFYAFTQSVCWALGSASIALVEGFLVLGFDQKESHILLYAILAVLGALSTLVMLKLTESRFLKNTESRIMDLLPKKTGSVLAKYVITGAIIAFGAGLVIPLMTHWFDLRYSVPDTVSGLLLGWTSFVIGLATLASPYLAKRFGLVRAVVATQSLSTLFMLATPLPPLFLVSGAVYTVRAFLMNMSSPLEQSMIMGLAAENERGATSGISAAMWRLPNAISVLIGSWMMGIGLLFEPFYLAALFYVISIVLFWLFFRRTRMPEETAAQEQADA